MTLFLLFFFELLAYQGIDRKIAKESQLDNQGPHTHSHFESSMYVKDDEEEDLENQNENKLMPIHIHLHFAHAQEHQDPDVMGTTVNDQSKEQYYGQLLGVFVLNLELCFIQYS